MCNTEIKTGKENFKLQSMAGQLFFTHAGKLTRCFILEKIGN